MLKPVFLILYLFCSVVFGCRAEEQTEKKAPQQFSSSSQQFELEELAKDLDIVWGMVFISSDEMLFTELDGDFKKLNLKTRTVEPIKGSIEVYNRGQGGLLDISLHPDFSKNKRVYFSYSKREGSGQTTGISYGILQGNELTQIKEIFSAQPVMSSSIHFGSRLVFDKQGFLFMAMGDRHNRHLAQSLETHMGKILRMTDEGQAPPTNPFVKEKDALPEIWTRGHRNPQGLYIHPETGGLWANEHGPRGGDEINLIEEGKNYGWPVITYGREYWGPKIGEGTKQAGLEQPVKYYVPSIAPCGLLIYSGKQIPEWKGDFFSGALVLRHLNRIKIVDNKVVEEERLISDLRFRVRNVIEGPKGYIYISVDEGSIFRIKPVQ